MLTPDNVFLTDFADTEDGSLVFNMYIRNNNGDAVLNGAALDIAMEVRFVTITVMHQTSFYTP